MNTKQEKLAAARKKLKEFQGKQREQDLNRAKSAISPANYFRESNDKPSTISPCYSNESIHANQDSPCTPTSFERSDSKMDQPYTIMDRKDSSSATDFTFSSASTMPLTQEFPSSLTQADITPSTNKTPVNFFNNSDNVPQQSYPNGLYTSEAVTYSKTEPFSEPQSSVSDERPDLCTFFKDSQSVNLINVEYNPTNVQPTYSYPFNSDPKDFFGGNFSYDNTKVPNTAEANTAIPPVTQLVDEKNNLLQVLKRTEELLKYKTDQEQCMAENVTVLQTRVKELEGSLLKLEGEVQDLRANNVQFIRQKTIDDSRIDELQKKFDSKEEQFLELQQKLELKTKECEYLSFKLNEAQSQLSSSMIKIQQLTVGESPALSAKIVELQNENATLLYKIQDLEKSIEALNKEKEESSLNFHNYAEQCNNQMNSLSSEVRNVTKENQLLKENNEALQKNIKDLENAKNELMTVQENPELVELTNKLEELTVENSKLQDQLKDKLNEIELLQKEKIEKSQEVNQIYNTLQEIRSENLKLLEEREGLNNNQKLLAAMESDKVAAARAVSQNQKLKDQVVELEDAFVKLSHEKLQLTDDLARETHMRRELEKELEIRLKELELDVHCHDEHQHKSEIIINEGEDIEELRNIIRQLENDKTELLSRLNSNNPVKASYIETDEHAHGNHTHNDNHEHDHSHEHEHNHDHPHEHESQHEESDCCKKILQQMEEKVKKTMNEIAALDEEKEKLEHLVLQLQGETETIGEYISLYQTQRMLLRQRSKEKDDQLLQLSKDKEELKSKLSTLNDLVTRFITEKGIDCTELREIKETSDKWNAEEGSNDTAVKIQALISEIQSTNLINNQSVAFEHCPCCSGRLITI
ncbi:UNVERIFIED_CONTAM: hypothetical protein PYX00_006626 [Menopon gallinae]|uniref:Golgin subfamily A conserved domain-containing protein n=1 Tax=Menopon gallinae TaxID=328185 RepID=A0AAW2HXL9_9NEOP